MLHELFGVPNRFVCMRTTYWSGVVFSFRFVCQKSLELLRKTLLLCAKGCKQIHRITVCSAARTLPEFDGTNNIRGLNGGVDGQ